jgi:hypothetical protein
VNSFLKRKALNDEVKYVLSVYFCQKCYLVQLGNIVSPDELFTHYLYVSSTSTVFLKHCEDTAKSLSSRFSLHKKSLVMEIASNDGALLHYFQVLGIPVIGVDPAKNIVKAANKRGIPTIPKFFNLPFAIRYIDDGGKKPNLIFGANVLAHVPEINDFLLGVREVLDDSGTAVFEFPYIKGLFEGKFDTIYHEHVFYYSLIALTNLFDRAGLQIYDVEQTSVQGGSLRIFASHADKYSKTRRLKKLYQDELLAGYDELVSYKTIGVKVGALKKHILSFLKKAKGENKTVVAYSAPAKGNVLLNYFNINSSLVKYIVDKAPEKQGLYTPGTHLIVYPPSKVLSEQPDYLLILCWNIADEIMKQESVYSARGGKFVIPIPKLKVI